MRKSLRTRLLIWQVLLLTAVVVTFGSVVFIQWQQNLYSDLDAELLSSATVLEGTLRGAFPIDLETEKPPGQRPRRRPPPNRFNQRHENAAFPQNKEGDLDGNEPNDRVGRIILAGDVETHVFDLPHDLLVNAHRRHSTYFAIFDQNDQIIASSTGREFRAPPLPRGHQKFRFHGSQRELVLVGPGLTRILVGRDTGDFRQRSLNFLLMLCLAGFGILAASCVAGYWLTGRAIAPICTVSDTVESISGANIKNRIDASTMDSEFVQLSGLLNEMLDRLEVTIEQQRQFIADASHELRTPVSVIGMHAELGLSRERTSEEYQKTLQICLSASNRLRSLTDDLLVLAKSDAGQLVKVDEALNLSELAGESIEFLKPLADQNGVSLVDESQSSVEVCGDRRLLRQLIDNLLTNAIVHNRKRGHATISAKSSEGDVTLTVSDNGPGIPEADLPHLFDRFYRAGKARTRESGGSGLGLAICQSIAQIHGGKLLVESGSNGTTFSFVMKQIHGAENDK